MISSLRFYGRWETFLEDNRSGFGSNLTDNDVFYLILQKGIVILPSALCIIQNIHYLGWLETPGKNSSNSTLTSQAPLRAQSGFCFHSLADRHCYSFISFERGLFFVRLRHGSRAQLFNYISEDYVATSDCCRCCYWSGGSLSSHEELLLSVARERTVLFLDVVWTENFFPLPCFSIEHRPTTRASFIYFA